MNLSRRGFLGSVIGTLAVSQLPFVAEAIAPFKSESDLEHFRLSVFTNDGQEFWSPKAVPEILDHKIKWSAEAIILNKQVNVAGFKLYAPNGSVAGKSYFSGGYINLEPGHELKVNYTIDFVGTRKDLDLNKWESWIEIANAHVQMV